MSDVHLEPPVLEVFAATCLKRESGFAELRTGLDELRVPRDSFGYIPGIGNRVHAAYDEFVDGCAGALTCAMETVSGIADTLDAVIDAYRRADDHSAHDIQDNGGRSSTQRPQ